MSGLWRGNVILAAALEKELYLRLKTIPELTASLPVIRRMGGGDELWLFAVSQEQLDLSLEARIISVLKGTMGGSILCYRVYQLSILPVTRSGRTMQRAIEEFVNHIEVPNRLQMRNPEVLREIVRVAGTDGGDSSGAFNGEFFVL